MKIIMCCGMQSSGKTTWAKDFVKKNQDYKRVSRDDIRHMLSNYTFSKKNEQLVTIIERDIMQQVLSQGYNLVVDKMNLNYNDYCADREFLRTIYLGGSVELDIVRKEFPVTLEEAIARDKKRDFPIGEEVLRNTYAKYAKELNDMFANERKCELVAYDPNLPDVIVVDVDGTLADKGTRNAYNFKKVSEDKIIEPIKNLVNILSKEVSRVVIFSGRDDICKVETENWLLDNNVMFDDIYMRKTGDKRKDSIVKKEMFDAHIRGVFNCKWWIDDRRQVIDMVRNDLGLTCLDVAGNNF